MTIDLKALRALCDASSPGSWGGVIPALLDEVERLTAEVAAPRKLSFADLRRATVARQALWCPEQVPDLSFRVCELAGEVGEVCNVAKKLERERLGWRGSRDTVEHLAEELADVIICADLVALSMGLDLGKAVAEKFNATSEKVGLSTRLTAEVEQLRYGLENAGRRTP